MWLGKRNELELLLKFPYNEERRERLRLLPRCRWAPEEKAWVFPYTLLHVEKLVLLFNDTRLIVDMDLQDECHMLKGRDSYSEAAATSMASNSKKLIFEESHWGAHTRSLLVYSLKIRGYSSRTIRAYCGHLDRFYRFYDQHREISVRDLVPRYSYHLLNEKLSASYVNQAISAIKFYLEKVCGLLEENFPYVRPKKEHKLPNVLSQREVLRLLSAVENKKHRAIFYLIYSSGLRVGEVVRLRKSDIDRGRKTLHIRQGKGKKDRVTVLSELALDVVQQYLIQTKPQSWLFPGQYPGKHLSERTVQKIYEQAVRGSRIEKEVTVHSLRHSFATHLLEDGIDIRYIQELLGHHNLRTTEIYTHVAVKDVRKIVSPLDRIIDSGSSE